MEKKTFYAVIKLHVEYDPTGVEDEVTVEDVQSSIAENCDYNVSYNKDGIKIVDTEFSECLDYKPI